MSILTLTQRFMTLFVLVMLLLTGCGYASAPPSAKTEAQPMARQPELAADKSLPLATAAMSEEAKKEAPLAPASEPDSASMVGPDVFRAEEAIAESDDTVTSEMAAPGVAEPSLAIAPQQTAPLRAGEVDDNAQWDDYLLYRRNYGGPTIHQRDIGERYIIEVTDEQGRPMLGATVRFFVPGQQNEEIYSARTFANGQVLFHPLALDLPLEQVDRFQVEVEKEGASQQFTLTRFEAQTVTSFTERWTIALATQPVNSLNLDVLFLIDATGSMADEIAKIQSIIFDVSARIDALPEQPNTRYGLVTYRDRGDSFVTRAYEFTPDVRDFSQNLNTLHADGGDDYPESLNEGLHDALHQVEWRGDNTVQLIFLIADAPPHLDYAQDYDYAVEMETAAQRGIKIFPIASSGLDDQGEYIFRQLAQYTQGRFIFLTYEGPTNGGAPGDTTTHHVEDYSVGNLDNLLVRLVEEELAWQNPQGGQGQ